ncbi:hypothetical protein TK45_04945 [Bowmanella sp. JS7-9]|nr:hypothetical protein TK45_04945 [Bowmanella sp. JS7-9]
MKNANPIRLLAWGAALLLWLLPAIAMQFTAEVNWTALDFTVFAAMIGSVGLALDRLVHLSANASFRLASIALMFTLFLLIWVNLAVGIIGGDSEPLNLIYALVLVAGVVMAWAGRFTPNAMLKCCLIMAVTQSVITLVAIILGWGQPYSTPMMLFIGNGIFILGFLTAGALFYHAARGDFPAKTD